MFYIYFSFAFIAAAVVYMDSEKQQMPRWWSIIVFFAPVTMVYYIIKTRQKKSLIPITAFVVVFILVGIGESFLYSRVKNEIIYASYSPKAREILEFTDNLKYSVKQLNDLILQLDDMSRVDSTPEKMNEVLDFMVTIQSQIEKTHKAVQRFVLVVNDYRDLLIEEKFDWMFKIEGYYNEPVVVKYLKNLSAYIEAFSELLRYTSENFQGVASKDPVTLSNYDQYYMNYVRALESNNTIDVSRMQFQHDFLIHAPKLEPYLPTILQKRFVDIWNKR